MTYVRWLTGEVFGVARTNRGWMTWNLILAFIPAVLAVPLLWRPHRRDAGWWVGMAVLVLFLPNAPYVLTDLIHLRLDAAQAASDGVLVFGVLPIYGTFILLGMSAYLVCLEGMVREARTVRPDLPRWAVEVPVTALCSLGIVLGRIARLNSWDTITGPVGTLERAFATLTWRGAPAAFLVIFLAVWISATVLRVLVTAAATWAGGLGVVRRWTSPTN